MFIVDIIFFLLRYIPFWAVPLGMISFQYMLIFWMKAYEKASIFFGIVTVFCFILLVYYLYAGTPERSAQIF